MFLITVLGVMKGPQGCIQNFFSGGGAISRMTYVFICAAAMHIILINKSHNNAMIINDFFLLVCNQIICAVS